MDLHVKQIAGLSDLGLVMQSDYLNWCFLLPNYKGMWIQIELCYFTKIHFEMMSWNLGHFDFNLLMA